MTPFNGLGLHLGNLSRLSHAKTRSISPENFRGEKGRGGTSTEGTGAKAARDLGRGWKVSPSVDIEGPGAVQQIWMTPAGVAWRDAILRFYWDDEATPSVECPVGDLFACGWGEFAQVTSIPVCVNPGSAFDRYWPMPFRGRCRITMVNRSPEWMVLYYQVNHAPTEVPEDAAYFHARFRRRHPLPYGADHTILEGVRGQGHYVGTCMAWGVKDDGRWGEGEIKFFMDGDREFATVVGTRTEGRFYGSYDFDVKVAHGPGAQTIEYPAEPHAPFPEMPGRDDLEIV